MDKIWYIIIDGIEEGAYSTRDLSLDPRVNLDTLAWREGFETWRAIRDIPELKVLFEKESSKEEEEKEERPEIPGAAARDELVLDLQKEPSFFFLWLVVVIIVSYVFYEFFWS